MPSSRLLAGAVALAAAAAVHAAPTYHLVDLGAGTAAAINNAGAAAGSQTCFQKGCGKPRRAAIFRDSGVKKLDTGTEAFSINGAGDTVGDVANEGTGLYWAHGQHSVEVRLPYATTQVRPAAINNATMIAGDAYDMLGDEYCFHWRDGGGENLAPGLPNCRAYGINAKGRITGTVQFSPTTPRLEAFLWHDGHYRHLGGLGGQEGSFGRAINDLDHVAGYASVPGGSLVHAFFHDGTQMHDLGTLPGGSAANSFAYGINATDEIVGTSTAAGVPTRAFLYSGGALLDLLALADNPEGWQLLSANAINDDGTIVGSALFQGGQRAFKAVRIAD